MALFFRIGGVTVAVRHHTPDLLVPPSPSLSTFAAGDELEADFSIDVSRLGRYMPPDGPLLFDSGVVWTLHEDGGAYRIECRSPLYGDVPYKLANVDREFTRALVQVRLLDGRVPDALEYPLDELLVNAVVGRTGGVEVHACGVIDVDGNGYLFAGNSGDGKTTTARLWLAEGATCVSDDRVILRERDGVWWMYGTPWHGEAEIVSSASAPLRHVFTIDRSVRRNESSPLSRSSTVARLFACAFPPFHDADGIGTIIATIDRVAAAIPVSRFAFANDAGAVAFAREIAGRRAG